MATKAPRDDDGDARLKVGKPQDWAAGIKAVRETVAGATVLMGIKRSLLTLLKVNQQGGFDCPGCAWPDPAETSRAEFCENGAKAVAEEATLRRVGPDFFAEHSVAELRGASDHWLGQQGRLTTPMFLDAGDTHYRELSWPRAFDIVADALRALPDPDHAVFYTSGRTSNEAAFLYQLLVRALGTNNLPDCSNMCHESSGVALGETIGIGKGTVTLDDIEHSELIIIAGQNPGTNHPRMLTSLERAKRNGAKIVAVNPLLESGLVKFKNPQRPKGIIGGGTEIADEYCQIRLGGDQAFFALLGKQLLHADRRRGDVLDHEFIAEHTDGFDAFATALDGLDEDVLLRTCGLPRDQVTQVAHMVMGAGSVIVCWAMGLTQHRDAVATIREIVNFLLLRGNIGRPGAGACPVRGHSNVQGDRTMGIYERPAEPFLAALDKEFGITSPRAPGYDTVEAIRAMRDGKVKVFMGMGGNFVRATPDSEVTERAMRNVDLTVHVSTKLNSSHAVTGRRALIIPTLGRTEADHTGGLHQCVTVEDSMGMVHASTGSLSPADPHLHSEVAIVAEIGARLFPDETIRFRDLAADYGRIRTHISRVIPGFADFEDRIAEPGGFSLANGPRDSRTFPTDTGRAHFTVNELDPLVLPAGRLLLQTVRSHDQYNTTIYGMDDRYRGVRGGRRVVFVNPNDLARLGFADGDMVDLVSEWQPAGMPDVEERRASGFRAIAFRTAPECAAAYFPETNVLVPLDSTAKGSNTPTSKGIVIRLEPATAGATAPLR
jgi:molybdopterin-dependent oxidoreductase alpha subunit